MFMRLLNCFVCCLRDRRSTLHEGMVLLLRLLTVTTTGRPRIMLLFTTRCAQMSRAGVPWCSILVPLLLFWASRFHPRLSFRNPNVVSFTIPLLRALLDVSALITTHAFFRAALRARLRASRVLLRVQSLRRKHGSKACLGLGRSQGCFRQVRIDSTGATVVGYVAGNYVAVDLRLLFWWRNSPGFGGWWRRRSNIITIVLCFKTQSSAVAHVLLTPARGGSVVPLTRHCHPVPGTGGNTVRCCFLRYYVDNGIIAIVAGRRPLPAGDAITRVGPLWPAG